MARTHTGREDVVVVDGAYHGNTSAMVDLSPYKFDGAGGEGARPWVHKTPMPDPYRGRFRASREGVEEEDQGAEYLPAEGIPTTTKVIITGIERKHAPVVGLGRNDPRLPHEHLSKLSTDQTPTARYKWYHWGN